MKPVAPPPVSPRARQIRPGITSADYLAAFPAEHLRADLCASFGSVRAAAKHAGLTYQVVCRWLCRRGAARAAGLRQLLERCGLALNPYRRFLEPPGMTVVCPSCDLRRTRHRHELRKIETRVTGRPPLVRRPDGSYELPCRRHSPGLRGTVCKRRERLLRDTLGLARAGLVKPILAELRKPKRARDPTRVAMWNRAQRASLLGGVLPAEVDPIGSVLLRAPTRDLAVVRKAVGTELKKVKPNLPAVDELIRCAWVAHGRELGRQRGARRPAGAPSRPIIASVLARFWSRPFHLCPLCGLAIYARQWHRACYLTWLRRASGYPAWAHVENMPPRTRTRGPSPARDFGRNLRWLLAQRAHQRTRRVLAVEAGVGETTVREGVRAALRLLPGSWDLLSAVHSKDSAGNRTRQQYLPLPEDPEFQAMIDAGARDPLIRRLHGFGMPEDQITRLTGANLERVRGVVAGTPPIKNSRPPDR